jgi:hypothetical protein
VVCEQLVKPQRFARPACARRRASIANLRHPTREHSTFCARLRLYKGDMSDGAFREKANRRKALQECAASPAGVSP